MPEINLLINALVNKTTLRKSEGVIKDRFEKIGQMARDEITKGVEDAAPRVRRAMLTASDSILDVERRKRDLNKVTEQQNALSKEELRLQGDIAQMRRRSALVTAATTQAEDDFRKSRVKQEEAAQRVLEWEDLIDDMRRKHAPNTAKLAQEESKLKDIRLKGKAAAREARDFDKSLQSLRKLVKRETAEITQATFELTDAREALKQTTFDATKVETDLKEVKKEHEQLDKDLARSEGDLDKARQALTDTDRQLLRINEDVVKSNDKRLESNRRLAEAEIAEEKRREKTNGGGGRKKRGGIGVIGNMLTDLPFVPSGPAGAVMGSAVVVTMASAAEAAVTASQALVTLPAIAAAGAAAIGTLAMGFNGLGDALKHMDDPEKWAEALQSLSPAAQQAALEIKYLVDGPLGDLQDATQQTLFGGVAEQLHSLTDQLLPEAQALTQGISQSFNNMFDNAVTQLISPESQASIGVIVDNIVAAFQKLEPAVAPFVSAITKITETGSTFLPGFADAITNAANSFNNFITRAQQDGSLAEFIQKGIAAAVALKDVVVDVGKRIYETFGNKDPEEFKQTLDTMVDAAFAVAGAIVGISHVVNDLLKFIQPVADALGGWENLIKVAGGAFLAWKAMGVMSTVGELVGLLGPGKGVGGALGAIPGLSSAAGGALARLAALPAVAALTALITALGVSGSNMVSGFAAWNDAKAKLAIPGAPQQPIFPQQPQGPGIPLGMPALPGVPGAGPAQGTGNPLDVFAPRSQPGGNGIGPTVDYKSLYPKAEPGPTAGLPAYTDKPVPAAPPEGGAQSQSEKLDAAMSAMDPSQFMPSSPIGMPTMPMPGGMPVNTGQTSGYDQLNPGAKSLEAAVRAQFPMLGEIGGWRADGMGSTDHPSGNALDIAIPDWQTEAGKTLGDQINQFLLQNAGSLGVDSTIWRNQMQYASGQSGGQVDGHQNHIHARTTQAPNANGQPPLQYGTGGQPYAQPGYGYMNVNQEQVRQATTKADNESWDVGQARMKLQALKNIGASENDIREATRKVQEEEAQYNEALLDLSEAQQGTWKKVNESRGKLEGIGPGLDADFGAGQGLAGIADNLIRFTATMGMAPILGALSQMAQGSGGGYGLMGIMGAQNVANGMSPLGMHPLGGQQQMPYGPGGQPTSPSPGPGNMANFGAPGSPQATANMIYQQALSRGYTPQEAQAIVAYAIGESGLNPGNSGGAQGGKGAENEVVGLFQQKPAFAKEGGIDPTMRTDPVANTYAYLNQLEKNRHMPIEQALPATSGGGPLASGPGAQPQPWAPLMSQAGSLLGGAPGAAPYAGGVPVAGPYSGGGGGPQAGGMPQGMPIGQPPGAAAGPQQPVGKAAGAGGWQPQGGGGIGMGGGLMAAASTAAMGLDVMAPGAGQAAQTGMELMNRSIKYGGQLGAIGVSGLLETFGLSDSALGDPSKSWIGRAAAGVAGMAPAVPTTAGQTQAPVQPQQHEGQQGQQGGKQGPTVNIENFSAAENRNPQQIVGDLAFQANSAWTK